MTDKPHGNTGRRNAAKSPGNQPQSFIHARCLTADKAAWVKAAQNEQIKLTEWLIKTLNAAADKIINQKSEEK